MQHERSEIPFTHRGKIVRIWHNIYPGRYPRGISHRRSNLHQASGRNLSRSFCFSLVSTDTVLYNPFPIVDFVEHVEKNSRRGESVVFFFSTLACAPRELKASSSTGLSPRRFFLPNTHRGRPIKTVSGVGEPTSHSSPARVSTGFHRSIRGDIRPHPQNDRSISVSDNQLRLDQRRHLRSHGERRDHDELPLGARS